MRAALLILCSLFAIDLSAQVKDAITKFGETITPAAVSKQLHVIAGPEMEGRETATRGQERAASYIISQFEAAGLKPGAGKDNWEQHYPLYSDSLLNSTITVRNKTYYFAQDFLADLRSGSRQDLHATQVIFADAATDYNTMDLKKKVVMLRDGYKRGERSSLEEKMKIAEDRYAAAVLVISPSAGRFKSVNQQKLRTTGIYREKDSIIRPNIYYITPALAADILGTDHGENLIEALDRGYKPPAKVQVPVHLLFNKAETVLQPSNVLAFLEGTDKKDEFVFVTAHYDHLGRQGNDIYYGADDDGSGTSAVIEIATAFANAAKAGYRPRRSMVFMTVSGEEKGLLGSQYYTSHPIYPLAKTVADLNIDMVGRIDPAHEKDTNYLYIIGDNKLSSELRPINEKANNTYTRFKLDYKYNDPNDPEGFYYRSDHYMFAQHNIPIIFYFNGTHADYHEPTDTVDKIDFNLLARRARLVFYTAWDIANREQKLVVDRHEK
ncbi:M28 family peptidase [Chitinophaga sp. 212800010-3]|uniref:M28 family peptidase n=1 Tax=unclassified Chitinophaga TaxID=2619133 RepID=UPI002DEEF28E|nr:Peptidase M28 [Chitinophaga sp. 212800010-3]